jgi:HlyD family secretion protein
MDRIIEHKGLIKPKHWKYIALGVFVIIVFVYLIFRDKSSSIRADAEKLTIEPVFKGMFNDYIQVTGLAAPISTVYLDAIEGGRVEEIVIEEGNMVKKGETILRLSNNDLHLNILNSEAQLAEKSNYLREIRIKMEQDKLSVDRELMNATSDLNTKKRNYVQNKELYKDKLISREEMQQSEDNYQLALQSFNLLTKRRQQDSIFRNVQIDQLNGNLENMKRNLALVNTQLDYLNVKAPVDGQLGMLDAEIGQSVGRGQRIGQINVLTSFKVEAEVDEHYIDRIRSGLDGFIEKTDDTIRMRIKKVYPDVRNGRFKVDLVFRDSLPGNIRTGQTYYIKLELGQSISAIQVARGGFFQNTGGQWIFVVDPSGNFAVRRNIRIGRQNPQYYEVLEGLNAGEKVITSGYDVFGNNDKIILK